MPDKKNFLEEITSSYDDDNSWAVSYGDVMSLLLAFFVMILSFATVNEAKYDEVRKYLSGDVESLNDLEELKIIIESEIKKSGLEGLSTIKKDSTGVSIIIKNDILFLTGEAILSKKGINSFGKLIDAFSKIDDKYNFQIEGHTDDIPIRNKKYRSNWELSTDRALSVLNLFLNKNFKEKRFSVQGFADQKPMINNRDKKGRPIFENMAKNRRVVIKIK